MSSQMSSHDSHLPSRFPAGTRYVIEGRGGRIHLRYLEFPDGRTVTLPAELAQRTAAHRLRRRRSSRKTTAKKDLRAAGTTRRVGS